MLQRMLTGGLIQACQNSHSGQLPTGNSEVISPVERQPSFLGQLASCRPARTVRTSPPPPVPS